MDWCVVLCTILKAVCKTRVVSLAVLTLLLHLSVPCLSLSSGDTV